MRENPDGAVLLHCFAGCEVADVVAALGLQIAGLFPPRDRPAGAPKRAARVLTPAQALEILAVEVNFAAVATTNAASGVVLAPADLERLRLAAGRINTVRDATVHGGRHG